MTQIENYVDLYNQIKQNLNSVIFHNESWSNLDTIQNVTAQNSLREQQEEPPISLSNIRELAHDINNMLAVISGYLELIKEEPQGDQVELYIERSLEAAGMLSELNKQYLNASPHSKSYDSIDSIVKTVKQSLLVVIGLRPDIRYSISVQPGTHLFDINPLHLRRIVQNLAKNAIEAMPESGTLSIKFENEERRYDTGSGFQTRPYVKMSFKDDGRGISKTELKNIFNSGYTTKQNGTGLGLRIAQYLVQYNNGHIDVSSSRKSGTVFMLHFPAVNYPQLKFFL